MLTSMMVSTIPTRAEISDIYNAVMDSVDAVCLNKETSLGNHPVESVQMMTNIIEVAEEELDYGKILRDMNVTDLQDVTSSIGILSRRYGKSLKYQRNYSRYEYWLYC